MVSEVYIKVDEHNNVVRVEGGASQSIVGEDWIKVDEGVGDRYYLCQNHYLEKSILMTPYGLYRYAYINGQIVEKDLTIEIEELEEKRRVEDIRRRREVECFSVINRGTMWFDTLTEEQKAELSVWYHAWLDAPQTMMIPDKPTWLE